MPKAPVSQGRIHRLNMRLLSLLLIAALMLSVLIAVPVLNSSAEQDMATKSAEWVDKENGIAKITLGVNDPTTSGSGSTTATTKPTEATTTTTTSSSTVGSKLLIDWDKQENYYYAIKGTSTINSTDDNGINLTVTKKGRILGTYNNDTTGYDGITFTAKGNGSLRAVVVSVETSYTAVSESGTTFILDFAKLGITPSETTEINFEVEDACELTISDIYLYSNTDNVAVAAVALSDDTSTAIVTYDFDNKIPTYSTIGSSVDSSSVYSATVVQYNSSNALKVNSNYWDGEYSDAFKAQDEYVKIDITETGIKSILFDAITVVDWYKYNGHYGVMIDGTIYWDNQYDNGLITRDANSTYTIESGTKLYSFTGSFSSAENVVEKTLTETDISNIQAIVFKTINHGDAQTIYVDNIKIVAEGGSSESSSSSSSSSSSASTSQSSTSKTTASTAVNEEAYKTGAVYTDIISDDFEIYSFNSGDNGWFEVYENGAITSEYTVKLADDGKTVTWQIPDITQDNQLIIYVKLTDENLSLTGTHTFKTNTSANVITTAGDTINVNNPQPTLTRSVDLSVSEAVKNAEWESVSDGTAAITLDASIPDQVTETLTLASSDTTVILDRSYSMTFNNCYTTANEAAQTLFDTYGVSSYDELTPDQKDAVFNAAAKEAGYQGDYYTVNDDGTLLVDSYHGAYSEWCSCGEHTYIIKLTEEAGKTLNQYLADESTTGLKELIDSEAVARRYLVDGNVNYTLNIDSDHIFVNGVWFGYQSTNNQALLLDVNAFKEWAAEKDINLVADKEHGYNASLYRPYGHLGKNAEGKYEIITQFENVKIKVGDSYVNVTDSSGVALQVPLVGDYAEGCIDYLADAQDGLQQVVSTVFSANGSRIGYMQFGNTQSNIYNSGKYYTVADDALNDIVTYRNPASTSREAANLTYERIKNGAATLYSSGLNDAATSLVPNLASGGANKTQFVLFVSDGKPSDPDIETYYESQVEKLVNKIKNINGVEKVYFYTVGINLSEEDSIYLQRMAEFANSIVGVTGVYGDYIDVKSASDLGTQIKSQIVQQIATLSTYTDVISDDFDVDITRVGGWYEIYEDGVDVTSDYTGTISLGNDGKTVTWGIPDITKSNTLKIYIKLTDENMKKVGTNYFPTNDSASLTVGSTSYTPDNEIPTLKRTYGEPNVHKSANWQSDYLNSGYADITLTAHDPYNNADVTTTVPSDTTVILDRSYSMTFNNCYTTANEAAQALFDTYGVSSYDSLNAEQKNAIFNAAAAKAGYQGNTVTLKKETTILDVGPGYGAYSEWCGCEDHAYIIKITDTVGDTLKRYLNDTTTTGLKVLIDSKKKAEQYLVDKQENYTIMIDDSSMFINGVWFGYQSINNQALLLDVHAFKEWAAENDVYLTADVTHGYNTSLYRPYGHMGKNSDGKYEIITRFENVQIKVGGSYVDVTNSEGSALKVPLVGDYAKGCIDYLADAQDGLQKVVETVFAADGSRVGYMQFGDTNSVIYNNGKYYTTAESSLNDIVTYRNPESTSREATNLTYERIKNGAATLYSKGLNDAASSLVPNLASGGANKTQFVLFVSDGKPSDPDSETYYESQVEKLVNTIKEIDGVEKVYFYTVGINLSEEDSIYLQKMAEFANSIDGVTGVYGDYIDVQNAADLGTEVGTKVSQVASGSAVYTDVLSEYFEFVEPLSYKLTIADDKNYTENASVVTQSSSVSYSADTLTWIIPEPTKYSKLTFTVKLKDSYMSSGVTNVPTNASATFVSDDETWSDSAEDPTYLIEKPKLSYENASVAVDKTIEWISSDGIAKVTATLAVRGSNGQATFTDSIDTSVFEYYSDYAPTSSVGDAPIVSNGAVSWSKSDMSYNDGIVTLTYYIKVKNLEKNGTLEDSASGNGPTFKFGDITCTETSGESTFSMTTLDIEYNKFSVTARVTDKNNTSLPTDYTIKDGNGIEFAVNVTSNDVYTDTSSANAEVGAGTYTFNEYKGSTQMVSGTNLTVTYDINYANTNVLETENTSSYTATTLTTQVVKKGTANTTSATVTFINDYTVSAIGFEVVKMGTDGKYYGGAEFALYEGTGNSKTYLDTLITAENTGIGTYQSGLEAGKTYTLIETKAPSGLELYGKEIVFTANASSSGIITYNADTNKLTCTVTDTLTAQVIDMPETGGYALYVIIAGIAMMIIAAIYLVVTKRRRNDDDEEE